MARAQSMHAMQLWFCNLVDILSGVCSCISFQHLYNLLISTRTWEIWFQITLLWKAPLWVWVLGLHAHMLKPSAHTVRPRTSTFSRRPCLRWSSAQRRRTGSPRSSLLRLSNVFTFAHFNLQSLMASGSKLQNHEVLYLGCPCWFAFACEARTPCYHRMFAWVSALWWSSSVLTLIGEDKEQLGSFEILTKDGHWHILCVEDS